MTTSEADLWDDLMYALEEGHVVPIVGRDLLSVETEHGPQLLHRLLADRLATRLGMSTSGFPAEFDTNDVICAYDGFRGDPTAIMPTVFRVLKGLEVKAPESLRLLAEIPALKLFVTTTVDELLKQAITTVRGCEPWVVTFPAASGANDFDQDLLEAHRSVVFHLLGRASASAPFAVTEGQVLEQMHDLMARPPEKLIARLQESHLLILGVSFPDWLTRFLLRLARSKPLWDSRSIMEIIADRGDVNTEFAGFVRRFSPQKSRVFASGSPVEFVRELHRCWFARHPCGTTFSARGTPTDSSERRETWVPGSIFVSYASEDRTAASRLVDSLKAAGLDVWIDQRLAPGDEFQHEIRGNIFECSAFIAIMSRNTQTHDDRYFHREWKWARRKADDYTSDRPFLFPVIVDDTPNAELRELRREMFDCSAARALDGVPPDNLIAQLDTAQKAWRRQHSRP